MIIHRKIFALSFWALLCWAATTLAAVQSPTTQAIRRAFQSAELITAKPSSFIFNPGDPPRIIWRDADEVRRLGFSGELHVRWFDAKLNEVENPKEPGRWGAYIEGASPNGTPLRRAMTFYCRPPGFFVYWPQNFALDFPPQPGPITQDVWREHQDEISGAWGDMFLRDLNDHEITAILMSGLSEAKPLGHAPLSVDAAAVANDDFHLALKLKAQGLDRKVRTLQPPHVRAAGPAPILHTASLSEAGIRPDAKARIDNICRAWADDSGEPFVTLVARHGVIVTHEAFGRDKTGATITLDYRADVASITKTSTAMLFSQFVDQNLIALDDSVATVFPDYPRDSSHVPTFRQCLTHTSGLSGHGDFGGVRNAHLENIILNAIDVNQPGALYNYSGMGFDLTGKAMEIVAGQSALRLYAEHFFGPLGIGDVPMQCSSSGARFTVRQLGTIAQYMANRGSYGELEFVSEKTFEQLLPEQLADRYPGINEESEGIGMHWMKPLRPGAKPGSTDPKDLIFSPRTIGHGSLTSCILMIDLDRDLIIVQIRRGAGPRYGEWSAKFFQAIVDSAM